MVNTNINKANNFLPSQLSEHKQKSTTYIVMSLMNLKDLDHVSPMILMLFVNDLPEVLCVSCIILYVYLTLINYTCISGKHISTLLQQLDKVYVCVVLIFMIFI